MTNPATILRLLAATALLAACGGGGDRAPAGNAAAGRPPAGQAPTSAPVAAPVADGVVRHLADLPFDRSWDLQLPAAVHRSWISPRIPNLLFVQVATGEIHGIDAYTGITRFVTRALPRLITLDPCVERVQVLRDNGAKVDDDRLYVISADNLYVFDCVYGQLIWNHHLGQNGPYGFEPSSGPMALGFEGSLRVYVGDWQGRIRVISYEMAKSYPYVRWQWNLQTPPTAQPVGHENLAYVGDRAGVLSCFGLDRERRWTFNTRSPILSSPLIRDHSLYLGAEDGVFHALDRLNGREFGALYLPAAVRGQPFACSLDGERVYAWTASPKDSAQDGLRAIHTRFDTVAYQDVEKHRLEVERLAEDWFLPGVSRLVASSPGHFYVTRPDSLTVLDVDRKTGKILWNWNLTEERNGADAIAHVVEYQDPRDELRSIITASKDGRLVAWRLFGHQR